MNGPQEHGHCFQERDVGVECFLNVIYQICEKHTEAPLCCCVEAEMSEISRLEPIKPKTECESSSLTMKIVVLT